MDSMGFLDDLVGAEPSTERRPLEAPADAVVQIDESGRVAGWSAGAERIFGWPASEILGQPVLTALIAPRHRELFESLLDAFGFGRRTAPQAHWVEVDGLSRDGAEVSLEISATRLEAAGGGWRLAAVCRDVTERREMERLLAAHDAIKVVLRADQLPEQAIPSILEAVCSRLGWAAGALWRVAEPGSGLQCLAFWCQPSVDGADLGRSSRSRQRGPAAGLPTAVRWAAEPLCWAHVEGESVSPREAAAVRAGLQSAAAVPIRLRGEVIGVLECYSTSAAKPPAVRIAQLEAVALELGRHLQLAPASEPRLTRYKLETRNTDLAFSCALMKFLTVHGVFREFTGWVEVLNDDPRTARAECIVKTASVDTRSLERDYHLRSADFFAVERYPELVYRSRSVEPLGDGHFRVIGELTIRNVTRPLRLDVRLEERETDGGVERLTLSAGAVINRLDWFLDWERALQAGRWIVGNEVRLDLVITLVRRLGALESVR